MWLKKVDPGQLVWIMVFKRGNRMLKVNLAFFCHRRQLSFALSLAYVLCTLIAYIANSMDPDQVHSVCFHGKSIQQWGSQNAEKVTHIKGKLLDQAVILFNCVPFQNGNFS